MVPTNSYQSRTLQIASRRSCDDLKYVKKELKEPRLRKKLDGLRTARKRILTNPGPGSIQDIRRLRRAVMRLKGSWTLDGHTRDILTRLQTVLESDIAELQLQSPP